MESGFVRQLKTAMIRASVDRSPDGNLWLTLRDADTGAVMRPSSGPYTDARHFLDVCRVVPITRSAAEEMHAVAMETGHAISDPLILIDSA